MPTSLPSQVVHVQRLIAAPGRPPTLFALLTDGRLLRSDDGGSSWLTLPTTGVPTNAYITGIGIDYRNPRTFYLTSSRGIFRSSDEGRSWSLVNTLVGQGITVSFENPNMLWTAVTSGRSGQIMRSSDGGKTWPSASSGYFGYRLSGPILIDPEDSNTLYAISQSVYGGQFFFRGTRDNQWNQLPYPNTAQYYGYYAELGLAWSSNTNRLFVGSVDGKLYASRNAKTPDVKLVEWQVVSSFDSSAIVSALARSEPNETLYITLYDLKSNQAHLMKSPDGGATWQQLNLP